MLSDQNLLATDAATNGQNCSLLLDIFRSSSAIHAAEQSI